MDALRALAVLAVFGVHARAFWLSSPESSGLGLAFVVDRVLAQGAAGVDLFVVLSGFCLTYPLVRGRASGIARLSPRRFYRRRALRILPAYYAVLGGLLVLESVPALQRRLVADPLSLGDVVTHLLLLQPLDKRTLGAVNGPFWSISLEITLYAVFPLLLVALQRYGWTRVLGGSILLAACWHVLDLVLAHVLPSRVVGGDLDTLLPAHLFQFALGMFAAELLCRPRPRQSTCAALALVTGAVAGAAGTIVNETLLRTAGWGAAAFGLTVLITSTDALHRPALRRPVRIASTLGLVSYSFYLLHQPFLLLSAPLLTRLAAHPLAGTAVTFLVGVPVMYLLARAAYVLVERPFLRSGSMRDAIVPDRPPQVGASPALAGEPR